MSITVLLYDFSTMNENFLLFSLLLLKSCSSQVLATFVKIFQCSILHFEMFINSLNAECKN